MSVIMVIQTLEIINAEMYDEYRSKAREIIASYGGKYLASSSDIIEISKDWHPEKVTLIQFPDRKSLDDCFSSAAYNAVKHLRINSVKGMSLAVESF